MPRARTCSLMTESTRPRAMTSSAEVGSSATSRAGVGGQRRGDGGALREAARKLVRKGAPHPLGVGYPRRGERLQPALARGAGGDSPW